MIQKATCLIIFSLLFTSCAGSYGTENLNPSAIRNLIKGATTKAEVTRRFGLPVYKLTHMPPPTVKAHLIAHIEGFSCLIVDIVEETISSKDNLATIPSTLDNLTLPSGDYSVWFYDHIYETDRWLLSDQKNCYLLFIVFNDQDVVVEKKFIYKEQVFWRH